MAIPIVDRLREVTSLREVERLPDAALELAPPVRLTRHVITLDDGQRVGVAVAGRGVPLVVVHGFGVEALLYAQPLARLAALGYRVVAIDVPGHGDTDALPGPVPDLAEYAGVLGHTLAALGVRRAVLAGHSMGGRLVAEIAATAPERAIAVLLIDAIVGETWEQWRTVLRWFPPALAVYGVIAFADLAGTLPLLGDTRQALKITSRAGRTILGHLSRPWRAFTPGASIIRAEPAGPVLDALRRGEVPVYVLHGDRDLLVPLSAARDTASRTDGTLIVVRDALHSWLLRCPETLPAIVAELLEGTLGEAQARALRAAGVDPDRADLDDVEAACYEPGAPVLSRGGRPEPVTIATRRRRPGYRWEAVAAEA